MLFRESLLLLLYIGRRHRRDLTSISISLSLSLSHSLFPAAITFYLSHAVIRSYNVSLSQPPRSHPVTAHSTPCCRLYNIIAASLHSDPYYYYYYYCY